MKITLTLTLADDLFVTKGEADMLGRVVADDIAASEVGQYFNVIERRSVSLTGQPYKVWPKVEGLKEDVKEIVSKRQLRAGLLAIRASVDNMLTEAS